MNRTHLGLLLLSVVATSVGCNPASLSYFLFRGDGKAPAEEKAFVAPNGKREVAVAVFIAAPQGNLEFAGLERDLTGAMARSFDEQTKDKKPHVRLISPTKIQSFKTKHPGWKSLSVVEMARELGANYVMDVSVNDIDIYEPGTGRNMYLGRATAEVKTYDVATGELFGNPSFVTANTESRPADTMPGGQYRQQLVQRLAIKLTWKHIPHVADQRINAGQ
jgi:hypothetical protein